MTKTSQAREGVEPERVTVLPADPGPNPSRRAQGTAMPRPSRHAVAQALADAYCPAGTCSRDVDQLHAPTRARFYGQADNLIADPAGLLAALGIVSDDVDGKV